MNRRRYIHRPCIAVAVSLACGIWLGTRTDAPWMAAGLAFVIALVLLSQARWSILRFAPRPWPWASLRIPPHGWKGQVPQACSWGSMLGVHALFMLLGVVSVINVWALPTDHVAHLNYEQRRDIVGIEGVIASDPWMRQTGRGVKTSFELSVERIMFDDPSIRTTAMAEGFTQDSAPRAEKKGTTDMPVGLHASLECRGRVLVNVFRKESLQYGDRIRLTGKLHRPFTDGFKGRFSYADHLKRHGIHWVLSVKRSAAIELIEREKGNAVRFALLKVRRKIQAVLDKHLTAFESGVVQSLVLGGRYYIPDRTRELFVQTGTAHILAISGMNVGGMAFLVFLFLNVLRLPRRAQITLTCLSLIVYCFLTGSNPSVIRATVMAVVMLAGFLFERQTNTLNSLGFAAVIILLFDPLSLFDIGFQLSFMGVFSIIYMYPRIFSLCDGCTCNRFLRTLLQALSLSFAAWIGVLPLIAYYFQIITPVSILANIPIIPLVSALFMLGAGLIFVGILCPPAAYLFAVCIKAVLFTLMTVIDLFSKCPFGYMYIPEIGRPLALVYYLVLALVFWKIPPCSGTDRAERNLHFLG